jgi:hypothetical protein
MAFYVVWEREAFTTALPRYETLSEKINNIVIAIFSACEFSGESGGQGTERSMRIHAHNFEASR